MSQKIFNQIRNEWRANIWTCIELLIVSVVLWYVVDYMYVSLAVTSRPLGFDIDHCYKITVQTLPPTSPEYIPDKDYEAQAADNLELLSRLRSREDVEFASLSVNSTPYSPSNSSSDMHCDTLTSSGYTIQRDVSPDFVRVFRYRGARGETPEQLSELLAQGKMLITDNLFDKISIDPAQCKKGIDAYSLIGKPMYKASDTTDTEIIGGVLAPVLYSDFNQGSMNVSVLHPLDEWFASWAQEFSVRVKPSMEEGFVERVMADADKLYRVGNRYVANVKPFADIREAYNMTEERERRDYLAGMGFLMVNIFLGLLGTFWFRTQQRVPDIAVRKVSGATRSDIFRLLIGEGLLLLTIVTPLAVLIDYTIVDAELTQWLLDDPFVPFRFPITVAVTYLLMSLMIILGLAIPANRAMNISPSLALRAE